MSPQTLPLCWAVAIEQSQCEPQDSGRNAEGDDIGPAVDTFGGTRGEKNARTFDVHGYPFLAGKPEMAA